MAAFYPTALPSRYAVNVTEPSMELPPPLPHRYLTDDLPGVGGILKERPEDFLVEELPLYEPSGEGEHLYLYIEKRELTTQEAASRVARAFRIGRRDVSWAGLKDKHAVTRQHLSLHLPKADADAEAQAVERINEHDDRLRIHWADRHGNKLRRGHLAGNRFVIRVRQVDPTHVLKAKPILDLLTSQGVPNLIGEQRFGFRRNTHLLGRHLLRREYQQVLNLMLGQPQPHESEPLRFGREAYDRGDLAEALEHWPRSLRFDRQALDALRQGKSPAEALLIVDRNQRGFMLNALQSAIFNRVLAQRMEAGTFAKLLPGDVASVHAPGRDRCFTVDAATAAKENAADGRVACCEVSPTGPMWGPAMVRASGEVDEREREAVRALGLEVEDLLTRPEGDEAKLIPMPEGGRRAFRVPLTDPDLAGGVDEHGPYLRLAFTLPRGSYATTAMNEIMKGEASTG